MWSYIVKRLILILPTLLLATVLIFILSKAVPSDTLVTQLGLQGIGENHDNFDREYQKLRLTENHHLPIFYFSIKPSYSSSRPDFIVDYYEEEFYDLLSNGRYRSDYINLLLAEIDNLPQVDRLKVLSVSSLEEIMEEKHLPAGLKSVISNHENYRASFQIPIIRWHGFNNQYHSWITKFLKGDMGHSLIDARPVLAKLIEAIRWTLLLSITSLVVTFLIAYPLSIAQVKSENKPFDVWTTRILFAIYAIPKFWLATLLILFFTTAEYGNWTNIFPTVGAWYTKTGQSFWSMIGSSLHKFILPIIVITFPDVAYLSRLIRSNLIQEKRKPYILALMSKGIDSKKLYRDHLLPNTSIPIITLLAGTVPSVFSGSLVIEVIFGIPGIGRLLYDSILGGDWTIIYPLLMFIAIIAAFSFLLSDIVIALINPRINLSK